MPCSLVHAVSIETNGVGSTAPFLTITMSLQRSTMKTRPLPSFGARMPIGCAKRRVVVGKADEAEIGWRDRKCRARRIAPAMSPLIQWRTACAILPRGRTGFSSTPPYVRFALSSAASVRHNIHGRTLR